ncbi:MAG: dienelactone hydrolase family protein [Nocardioides sp.]
MAELIQIPAGDGIADAFVARPAETPTGGVLFFMDAIGLRPRIAEMVDLIASWGYLVLAPHVFYRAGSAADLEPKVDLRDPEVRSTYFQNAGLGGFIAALTPERVAADTEAYVATLQRLLTEAGAPDARLGATGYCMGARLSTMAAGQFPGRIVAAGGFNGAGLVTDDPRSPHRGLTAQAEYLYGHADNDPSMTPQQAAELEEALAAAGATYTAAIYPDAPHGYTMNDTASWHAPSYERHVVELKALFERTLG